jgi:hypothetical protein
MRDTQRHVDSFVDQADWTVEQLQADRNSGMALDEIVQYWPQHVLAGGNRRGHGQQTPRRRPLVGHQQIGLLEIGQDAPAGRSITFTRRTEPDRPRGPVQQSRSRVLLEERDGAAHRRRGSSEPAAGASQAAFVQRGHEHLHCVDPVHIFSVGLSMSTALPNRRRHGLQHERRV